MKLTLGSSVESRNDEPISQESSVGKNAAGKKDL
jgi:hypothetical protein